MKKILKTIINYKTERISLAALIISIASFLSFALGLVRDRLLSGAFETSALDAYYAAFRIPDFVALVLMMGAISVAIIPIFTENLLADKQKAFSYISNFLTIATALLIVVCGVLFFFAPNVVALIAPGFSPEKKEATVMLTRIMFLSPILLGVSNIISAVLMVFKRFLATSLAPIFYNIGSIVGIVFFVPLWGISGLAWGIVLGAFMHLIVQIPSLGGVGFIFKPSFNVREKNFIQTIKLTIPRAIGLTAAQVNFIIITAVGSTLLVGSVTIFNRANDLAAPIVGLIAIPFATAVFPALSSAFSRGDHADFLQKFHLALRQILFLIIPASCMGFLLRAHLVRIVFGSAIVSWTATRLTAACFGIFMFTLFAQGLVYLISKTFYAIKNTMIPTMVSIVSIIVMPVLAYQFIRLLRYSNWFSDGLSYLLKVQDIPHAQIMGLPLAIAVDVIIQILLLLFLLKIKIPDIDYKNNLGFLAKVLIASVGAVAVAYGVRQVFGGLLGSATFMVLLWQTAIVGVAGVAAYFIFALALKLPEVSAMTYFINRFTGMKINGNK